MAYGLILPESARRAQPRYSPRLDYANPVLSGVVAALLPWAGRRDPVSGNTWSSFGTAPVLGAGRVGLAADSTGAFGGLSLLPAQNAATAAQTHLLVVEGIESAAGYAGLVGTTNAAASATSLSIQRDAPDTAWRTYPGYTVLSTSLGEAFGPTVLALVGDANGSALWIDGALSASNAMAPTARADSRILLLGEQAMSAGYAYKGRVYLYVGWTRRLPDNQLAELTRNPWQLFEPDDTPVFYSLASGTSYTDSLSDSAAATDSASTALVALQSESDSAAATDAASTALQAVNALADTGAATDTATSAHAAVNSLADTAAASDTSTSVHAAVSALADSAAATDTASSVLAAVSALADSAAATDSATGDIGAQSYTESLTDEAAATDAIAHAASLSVALSDAAAGTDSFTVAGQVYTESLTDTLAATDSIGSSAVLLESCADLLAGSDIVVGEGGSENAPDVLGSLVAADRRTQKARRVNVQTSRRRNIQTVSRGN